VRLRALRQTRSIRMLVPIKRQDSMANRLLQSAPPPSSQGPMPLLGPRNLHFVQYPGQKQISIPAPPRPIRKRASL